MKRRAGISLMETVAAIAVQSAVLAGVAGLFAALYQSDRVGRERLAQMAQLDNLGEQFRRDVRAAVAADRPNPAEELVLTLRLASQRSVVYRTSAEGLLRIEEHDQAVVRRELFRLPSRSVVEIEIEEELGRVAMLLQRARHPAGSGEDRRPRQTWRVEAHLARDHRWDAPRAAEGGPADE